MRSLRLLLRLAAPLLAVSRAGAWTLAHTYDASNFFTDFTFWTAADPTHGVVQYVDQGTASSMGIAKIESGSVYLGVDTTQAVTVGRKSIRLSSNAQYTHGLFVADISHMPGSICGLWPAFWTTGSQWPQEGEIDIIEGVNNGNTNTMTLHTSPGLTMQSKGTAEGLQISNPDCGADQGHTGCGVTSQDQSGYGDGFNQAQGGVYAMEWTAKSISIWHFQRSKIPADISSQSPDPSTWGAPTANFVPTSGQIDSFFMNHEIVINTDFCGDWAGAVFAQQCGASTGTQSCEDYVLNNGEAFKEAYWIFNSIKVYQQ